MNPVKKTVLYLFAWLSTCSAILAQQYRVVTFGVNDGLPTLEVRCTIEDSLGFLWVGTDAGLLRFDGVDFTAYQTGLPSKYVKSIIRSRNSSLFFSNDAGVYKINYRIDSADIDLVLAATTEFTDSTLFYPNNLYEDSKGALWISEPRSSVVRIKNGQMKRFQFSKEIGGSSSSAAFSFTEDSLDNFWIASPRGAVFFLEERDDIFKPITPAPGVGKTNDIVYVHPNKLWLGGKGLIELIIGEDLSLISMRKSPQISFEITDIAPSSEENYFFSTRFQGLYKFNLETSSLEKIFSHNDPHRIEELPFNQIRHISITTDGNIWLSTDLGLGLLQTSFFSILESLPMQHIYSLAKTDEKDAMVSFGELYRLTKQANDYKASRVLGRESGFILGVDGNKEQTWAGNVEGELMLLQSRNKVRTIDLSQRGGGIFYVMLDSEDNLWICQAPTDKPLTGVAKLDPQMKLAVYEEEKGLDNRMLVLKEDPEGKLYAAGIGNNTYLYRYHRSSDSFINLSLPLPFHNPGFEVHDICLDPTGIIWLGTTDGLLRYDAKSIERVDLGEFTTVEVRGVNRTKDNSIWVATDTYGLIRYKDREVIRFDESSGLPSKITTYRTLHVDQDQKLWLGTAEGLVISQEENPQPRITPKPLLLSIFVNDEMVEEIQKKVFPYGTALRLEFTSLSYPGKGVKYQYQLINEEGDNPPQWKKLGTDRSLFIAPLSYGQYQLHIRAKQTGEFLWSDPLTLTFEVRKVWFKTWWAYTLFSVTGILLIWGFLQLNTYKLRKEKKKLEELIYQKPANVSSDGNNDLKVINSILNEVNNASSLQERMTNVFKILKNTYPIDVFGIGNYSEKENQLEIQSISQTGKDGYDRKTVSVTGEKNFAFQCVKDKKEISILDFQQDYKADGDGLTEFHEEKQMNSLIYLPIIKEDKCQGLITLKSQRKNAFNASDMYVFRIIRSIFSTVLYKRVAK